MSPGNSVDIKDHSIYEDSSYASWSATWNKGPSSSVPSDLNKVSTNLPRPTSESQIISLGIKCRLSDRNTVHKQYIRPEYVNTALQYLKHHNQSYSNVTVSSDWQSTSQDQDRQLWHAATADEEHTQEQEATNTEQASEGTQIIDSED